MESNECGMIYGAFYPGQDTVEFSIFRCDITLLNVYRETCIKRIPVWVRQFSSHIQNVLFIEPVFSRPSIKRV